MSWDHSDSSSPTTSSSDETDDIDDSSDSRKSINPQKRKKRGKYKRALHYGFDKGRSYYHNMPCESDKNQTKKPCPSNSTENVEFLDQQNDLTFMHDHDDVDNDGEMQNYSSSSLTSNESEFSDTNDSIDISNTSESDFANSSELGSFTSFSDSDDDQSSGFRQPLYENSRQTVHSSYTLIMLFVMKHSLSRDAFSDLLNLISSHLPEPSKFTTSVYKVKETLKKGTGFKEPVIHYYCGGCQEYLHEDKTCEKVICKRNDSKVEEFYDLQILDQLNSLFKDDNFVKLIQQHKTPRRPGFIADIVDGSVYRKVLHDNAKDSCETKADFNLTFTMNTDGVSLFSSSKKGSLWPVYLAINELPITLRFTRKYLLPCMLHCEVEKPNMLTYLSPLMQDLQCLHQTGIRVNTTNGKLLVKARLIAVATDLPARALVLNMKQFNGKYGCSICLDEGECPPGRPLLRFYPFRTAFSERTHQSMLTDANEACRTGTAVKGIKGASALMVLSYADLPKFFVIDWMHGVLLGVTKALMTLWLNSKYKDKDFFIGNKTTLLNKRLMNIKIPDFISRRQRGVDEHTHWKASEFREWLLHFSVPVLQGVLKSYPFVHYLLLVTAMSILTKEEITLEEIDDAEQMLLDFCKCYSSIYGMTAQSMNLHLLRHLANFTRLYGPLFCFSLFGFESMNSFLKKMVHGTRHINSQVGFAVIMSKKLPSFIKQLSNITVDQNIKRLTLRLGSKFLTEDELHTDKMTTPLGKAKKLMIGNENFELLSPEMKKENLSSFMRIQKGNSVFYGNEYKQAKTRNSNTVVYNDGIREIYGTITSFINVGSRMFAVMQNYETLPFTVGITVSSAIENSNLKDYLWKKLCPHMVQVIKKCTDKHLVPVENLKRKCLLLDANKNTIYISKPPNLVEHG